MNKIISECNDFIKDCGFPYAFCGGHALELFINKKIRPHSDIDISIFDEDRKSIVKFMLSKGWNIYGHPPYANYLRLISSPDDAIVLNQYCVWAVKPGCSLMKLKQKMSDNNLFEYEIISKEQINFDFIEIIFNSKRGIDFICDKDKNITRKIDKAILYNDGIPYLSPELMLFIISNPAYMKSDYHRDKNSIDFNSTAPYLPKESRDWLIKALEIAYPDDHERLEALRR